MAHSRVPDTCIVGVFPLGFLLACAAIDGNPLSSRFLPILKTAKKTNPSAVSAVVHPFCSCLRVLTCKPLIMCAYFPACRFTPIFTPIPAILLRYTMCMIRLGFFFLVSAALFAVMSQGWALAVSAFLFYLAGYFTRFSLGEISWEHS